MTFLRWMLHRRRFAVSCGALLFSSVAGAQAIGGRVVDSASAKPLPGVLVVLLDSAGTARGQDLTDASGAWHLSASPGVYRIRTLRIGFRPYTSAPIRLDAGQTVQRDVTVASRAVLLDTVRVAGRNPCRVRPEAGATAQIWEQARGAIMAAQVTARARRYEVAMLRYERTLPSGQAQAKGQSATLQSGQAVRPWVTLPLDSVRTVGYVYRRGDGAMIFNAPDLELLLSDDFAADHCFRVVRESEGPDARIGMAFEPTRERVVPEVAGTIWLDAKTAELRQLEFRYVNIDPELERAGAGGGMSFARFANGGWSIARWDIRWPLSAATSPTRLNIGNVNQSVGGGYRVVGMHVAGGELVLVMRGADTLWSGTRRRLAGLIVDSATGRGIRGAVRIDKLNAGVNADGQGRFAIPGVLPGTYQASVIDATGRTHARTFTFVDEATPVVFRVAPAAEKITWRLDTVVVSAQGDRPGTIVEFENRRLKGVGRFLTTDELRDLDERPFTDVLRQKFPDIALKSTERAEVYLYNRRQQPPKALLEGGMYCYVQVIVDGVKQFAMGGADTEPPDFAGVQTRSFDAVEYYASVAATPPEYRNDGATCGTLILWSRRQ